MNTGYKNNCNTTIIMNSIRWNIIIAVFFMFLCSAGVTRAESSTSDYDHDGRDDSEDIDDDRDGYADCWEKDTYTLDHDNDGIRDTDDADDDGDGVLDVNESSTDARYDHDNDGTLDMSENRSLANDDNDTDKDGILDSIEKDDVKKDTDKDGKKNSDDSDDDKDGLKDEYESSKKTFDTDNDKKKNRVDTDADGDDIKDWKEGSCKAVFNYNCPSCVADIAIYDPPYSDSIDGGWSEEVTAFKTMANEYGWTYDTVNIRDLNTGILGSGDSKQYRVFLAPGGWAYTRDQALTETGEDYMREYVDSGGSYLGFCAGAYWASDTVIWSETTTGGGGTYNTESDYTGNYEYDLNLLSGSGKGALSWAPYPDDSMELVSINTDNPVMASIGLPETSYFFYGGGPFFTNFSEEPKGYAVWGRAKKPSTAPSGATVGEGEDMIIQYKYGKGRVVLSAYHPAFLLNSSADGVADSTYYDEDATTRYPGSPSQDEMNLEGWNIAHAAVQYTMHKKITAITELPQ